MVGGEFQQIGEFAEGSSRAKVVGVRLQSLRVAGIGLQYGVPVHRSLLAVAEPVVIERRQLAQQRQFCPFIGGSFQLFFPQLGQFRVVAATRVQLGQVLVHGAIGRFKDGDLLVGANRFFEVAK